MQTSPRKVCPYGNEKGWARATNCTCDLILQMCRATAMAVLLMLWGNALWGATLEWDAVSDPNLAGYKVYQCNQTPCSKSSGTALATLGTVSSFDIGTPAVTQYFFVTAYNFENLESSESNVVTYLSAGTSRPPAATVSLTVLGSPNLGQPWAVQATTNAAGTVSVEFWINGALDHTEGASPYCSFGNLPNAPCTRVVQPAGSYTVEARVLSNGEEVARQAIVINATGVPFPAETVSLTVLGLPNLGQPWAVQATTNAAEDVSVEFWINNALDHTEGASPYCSFGNLPNAPCTRVVQPAGSYTVEARVLSNGEEVARQAIVINATGVPFPAETVSLT